MPEPSANNIPDNLAARAEERPDQPLSPPRLAPGIALVLLVIAAISVVFGLWGRYLNNELDSVNATLASRVQTLEQKEARQSFESRGEIEEIGLSLNALDESLSKLWEIDSKSRQPEIKSLQKMLEEIQTVVDEQKLSAMGASERIDAVEAQLRAAGGSSSEGLVGRVATLVEQNEARVAKLEEIAGQLTELSQAQQAHDKHRLVVNQALLRLQSQIGGLAAKVANQTNNRGGSKDASTEIQEQSGRRRK